VVGVLGPGGGSGVTTLAVSLGLAVAGAGRSVALVDADPRLGMVAAQLGLVENRSLFHLVHEATLQPVDHASLGQHLQSCHGLAVLAGRAEPGSAVAALLPGLEAVLGLLAQLHELILVDVGPLHSDIAAAVALRCQALVWVVDGSPLGADRLDRCLASSFGRPLRSKPQMVVINRAGPGLPTRAREWLAREYGLSLLEVVPSDLAAVRSAEERLLPPVLKGALAPPLRRAATRMLEVLDGPGTRHQPSGAQASALRPESSKA
jgi:MinD-like ATPase involved in chromosome partitioning or flagellar assembly